MYVLTAWPDSVALLVLARTHMWVSVKHSGHKSALYGINIALLA